MRRERKRNKIIIIILIGIIFLMGVGYAAFQTRLNITGTSNISSDWNIRIISAEVSNINGEAENVKNTYSELTADLEANLYNPGDYVEYDIVIENAGTFDAKLETLGITNSNNEAVKITSSGLTKGQTLYKSTSATLTVRIAYNEEYAGDASGTSGESTVDLDFVQNSEGTIVPTNDHLVTYDYTTNGGESTTAENAYIAEGEQIDLSYTASKENYEFLGWNTNPQAGEGLTSLTMGTSDITLYAIFKALDETPPVIENVSTTSTTNSITVVVTASEDISSIEKYAFKIDSGEYIDTGMNNSYTFTGLSQDTEHDISVKVTNNVGLQSESTKKARTSKLNVPTFSEEDLIGETTGPTEVSTSTSGTYAWTETNGVWKSGNYHVNSTTSTITFSFTLESTQTISFDWSVSSESTSYDYLYYTIYKNGSTVSGTGTSTKIGGTSYGTSEASLTYNHVTRSLDAGTYEVTFTYRKDSSQHKGLDRGYVKNFDAGTSTVVGTIGKTVTISYPEGEGLIYEYKKDNGDWLTATQNQKVEFTKSGTLIARVSDGTNVVTSSTYTVSIITYTPGVATDVINQLLATNPDELYTDEHGDIRYYGANPNNYVRFNNELWRIMGVIDGKIKIVRNESIGDMKWNSSRSNNWNNSSLKSYLNGDYYNSIEEVSRNMIASETYYLGGATNSNYKTLTASEYYNAERSTTVYSGNPTSTTQYIGLMYPSDYGYAAGESCLSTALYDYVYSCKNTDYLHKGVDQWLQAPIASNSTGAACLSSTGFVNGCGNVTISYAVFPVLYLESQTMITGGEGSSDSPFILG